VVRGRLGFGKLAGFQFASRMTVRTVARGRENCLVLDESDIDAIDSSGKDIRNLKIPIITSPIVAPPGTTIELSNLRPGLEQPDPQLLRAVLLREFGLPNDFQIFIDEQQLTLDDLPGEKIERQLELPDGTTPQLTIRFLPISGAVADAGISVRVDGRVLDRAPDFGLADDPDLPRGALRRVVIEVNDDGLSDDVTADWGGVIEDSERFQALKEAVNVTAKEEIQRKFESEASETAQEFVERWGEQLELIPQTERDRARRALYRVFQRLFADSPDRRDIVANLVIDVFNEDPHWVVAQRLNETDTRDLIKLADVLTEWGLGNVAEVSSQTQIRLKFLDLFDELSRSETLLELSGMHRVIESNAWILGDQYETWVSNKTMRKTVTEYTDKVYVQSNGAKRPDLIMLGLADRALIVELKRPRDTIVWNDCAQALEYRDSLREYFSELQFDVYVLGGKVHPQMSTSQYPDVRVFPYTLLVSQARSRLNWLVTNIDEDVQTLSASSQPRLNL
jgi:hypothetical protein